MNRVKPYPSQKDSGVPWLGRIPTHWKVAPGFSVFEEKKDQNTGMVEDTVLSLSYGRIVVKSKDKLHGLVPASFETYQIVNPDDIIIRPTDLQNDWTSLRVGIARDRGIITSAYLCLRTIEPYTPVYGYLLLHAYDLKKIFYGMGSGLRQNLGYSDLKRMPVLVPPPDEQRAIARFLDHHDRLTRRYIRAQRRLIALLEEQKQALIQRAVTRGLDPKVKLKASGVEWWNDVPEHWQVTRNAQLFTERNERGLEQLPILIVSLNTGVGIADTVDEAGRPKRLIEDKTAYKLARQNDIVYNTMRMWQGAVGKVPTDGLVSPAYVVAEPSPSVDSLYFSHLFRTQLYQTQIRAFSYGIVLDRNRLYWDGFKHLRSLVPPIEEQRAIAAFVASETDHINTALDGIQHQIDLVREYHTRLVADVVTGKLDVRDVALPEPALDEDADPLDDLGEELSGGEGSDDQEVFDDDI